jgi:hypothetical protein
MDNNARTSFRSSCVNLCANQRISMSSSPQSERQEWQHLCVHGPEPPLTSRLPRTSRAIGTQKDAFGAGMAGNVVRLLISGLPVIPQTQGGVDCRLRKHRLNCAVARCNPPIDFRNARRSRDLILNLPLAAGRGCRKSAARKVRRARPEKGVLRSRCTGQAALHTPTSTLCCCS